MLALTLLGGPTLAAEGGAGFSLLGGRTLNAGIVAPPGTCVQASLCAFSGSTSAPVPNGGRLQVGLEGKAAIGFLAGLWAPATEVAAGGPMCWWSSPTAGSRRRSVIQEAAQYAQLPPASGAPE